MWRRLEEDINADAIVKYVLNILRGKSFVIASEYGLHLDFAAFWRSW